MSHTCTHSKAHTTHGGHIPPLTPLLRGALLHFAAAASPRAPAFTVAAGWFLRHLKGYVVLWAFSRPSVGLARPSLRLALLVLLVCPRAPPPPNSRLRFAWRTVPPSPSRVSRLGCRSGVPRPLLASPSASLPFVARSASPRTEARASAFAFGRAVAPFGGSFFSAFAVPRPVLAPAWGTRFPQSRFLIESPKPTLCRPRCVPSLGVIMTPVSVRAGMRGVRYYRCF